MTKYLPIHLLLAAMLSLHLAPAAFAGVSGVPFSAEEIAENARNGKVISEAASACLNRYWDDHTTFFKDNNYSKYYGNRMPKHLTEDGRKAVLLQLLPQLEARVRRNDRSALEELDRRQEELQSISCIDLALNCLGEGFEKAGMKNTWERIRKWVVRLGPDGKPLSYGTDLQKALVDLGWKSLYFNPDLAQNDEWDRAEAELNPLKPGKKWNPVWGGHAYRWAMIKKNRDYYGIPVHDVRTLVNFGTSAPAEFAKAPFFVGTAHAGYHVFPGFRGQIIEAHSMRELNSIDNLEVSTFNPLDQDNHGGPRWTRTEHYRSGVIVVPPGIFPAKPFEAPGPVGRRR